MEIPPNHSFRVGSTGLDTLLQDLGAQSDSAGPGPLPPSSHGSTAGVAGKPAKLLEPIQDDEETAGAARDGDGHGFVRLPRIDYTRGEDLSDPERLGRDVNEVHQFDSRATLNPRIQYFYDLPKIEAEAARPETDRPFWGEDGKPVSGWVNRPPVANPDQAETDEDTPITLDPLANDFDADGHPLTLIGASAQNGTVAINPDGTVTYTPGEDFHGVDTITYTISDGRGGTATSTISVTVNPIVDAFDNTVSTNEDTAVITDVLANDTFGPNASVTSVTQGTHGTVTINADGTVTYTPNEDYHGPDSYTYTVTTAAGNTETATVNITSTRGRHRQRHISTNEDTAVITTSWTTTPSAQRLGHIRHPGSHGTSPQPDGTVTYPQTRTTTEAIPTPIPSPPPRATPKPPRSTSPSTPCRHRQTHDLNQRGHRRHHGRFGQRHLRAECLGHIRHARDTRTVSINPTERSPTPPTRTTTARIPTPTPSPPPRATPKPPRSTSPSTPWSTSPTTRYPPTRTRPSSRTPGQRHLRPNASVTGVTQGTHGTVSINPTERSPTPPTRTTTAPDSYTYTVTTAAGNTETATVNITVNPVVDSANDTISTTRTRPSPRTSWTTTPSGPTPR